MRLVRDPRGALIREAGDDGAVIEVKGLRKEYRRLRGGRTTAVADLDLAVPRGGVFGFLGPNGSGKTTTIRCLLGLVRPTKGGCRLLGHDVAKDLPQVIARVGSIVESPALFPNFSGRRNLQLLARIDGIDLGRVESVLETVDLKDRARDRVKTYSLGMRQRLGIAAALLKDPELLILDEPANGLDPAGIVEVRELIRRIGSEGRTVFVSSHILSEIQHTADRVAILARGRCITSGPVGEVLSAGRAAGMIVEVDDPDRALDAMRVAGLEASRSGDSLRVAIDPARGAEISRALAGASLYPRELRPDAIDLETVFLELTKDDPEAL